MAGWATLGMLVSFVQYADRAFQPILRLSEEYNSVQIGLGAAERVQRLLETTSAIIGPEAPLVLPRVRGAIELRQVSFAYVPDEPVLRDVSLRIPAGQTVAIVGATGAGKSSLVGLLARFYDPQLGQVLLDGVDIRRLDLVALRRAVAVGCSAVRSRSRPRSCSSSPRRAPVVSAIRANRYMRGQCSVRA